MEEAGDASGIAVVLGELRSEYFQIRKAELLMQRHRDAWMRSVEHWLDNQARAMKPLEGSLRQRRARHGHRKVRALSQAAAPQQQPMAEMRLHSQASHLGPMKPCPQPAPIDADENDDILDLQQDGPSPTVWESSLAFEDENVEKVPSDLAVEARRGCKPSRAGSHMRLETASRGLSSMDPEAIAQGRSMSKAAERLCTASQRRLRTHRKWASKGEVAQEAPAQMIVDHPLFDTSCAVMIALNSVIIGLEVERQAQGEMEEAIVLKVSGYVCSVFFILELCLRVWTQGRGYFCNENKGWNIFDLSLVVLSIVDAIIEFGTQPGASRSSMATGMKTVKMLRIVRVFRVFRFFRELSLLALMIVDSTANLGWAIILLALIIYVFAILFTSEAASYINEHGMDDDYDDRVASMRFWFGNLPRTIYSLIQAMLGGVSWGVCSDSLLHLSVLACGLFIFYVAFTILAVMNVVTGVFVDNAVETARTTRDFLIAKEIELKEKYASEMRDLFIEMDKDGSGTVGLEEIKEYLEDPRVQAFFNTLGLDTGDTERLFKLIDDDGSGDVDVGEFLDGCLRLKGQARSLDVYAIMHDLKSLESKVDDLMTTFRAQAMLMSSSLSPMPPRMERGRPFRHSFSENSRDFTVRESKGLQSLALHETLASKGGQCSMALHGRGEPLEVQSSTALHERCADRWGGRGEPLEIQSSTAPHSRCGDRWGGRGEPLELQSSAVRPGLGEPLEVQSSTAFHEWRPDRWGRGEPLDVQSTAALHERCADRSWGRGEPLEVQSTTVTSASVATAAKSGDSQSSRSSHWATAAQSPSSSRTPQVVTVTTTATATLI